jgi:hypothetical protein
MGADWHIDGEVGPATGSCGRIYLDGRVDRVQQDGGDQFGESGAYLFIAAVLEPTDEILSRLRWHPGQPVIPSSQGSSGYGLAAAFQKLPDGLRPAASAGFARGSRREDGRSVVPFTGLPSLLDLAGSRLPNAMGAQLRCRTCGRAVERRIPLTCTGGSQ